MSDLPDIPAPAAGQGVALPPDVLRPQAPKDVTPSIAALQFRLHEGTSVADMDPALVARANRLYDAMPDGMKKDAVVSSGRRTTEQQAAAYERYKSGTGGLAAAPGNSRHESGAALDFNGTPATTLRWMTENASKYGLSFPFGAKGDPGHMQLAESGEKSNSVTASRRGLSSDDLPDVPTPGTWGSVADPGTAVGTQAGLLASEEQTPTGGTAEYSRASAALMHGIMRGIVEPPLAIAQATMPREQMAPIEAKLREMESGYEDLRNEHPTLEMVGRLTGATVSIMVGARLLGAAATPLMPTMAAKAAQAGWQGIGAVGRGAATGAVVGATNFYKRGPDEETRPFGINARTFDTGVGSVLGLLGGTIARSLEWGARNISDTAYGRSFMQLIQQTTNGTARNTGRAQTDALSYYQQVTATSRANYAVRNAAGRKIEGFPTGVGPTGTAEGFTQAIDSAISESKDAGVKSWVEGVGRGVKKTLGVEAEEGRWAEIQRLQKEYDAALDKLGPAVRFAGPTYLRQLGERLPKPPSSFVSMLVPAESYAQARTEINAAINRAVRSNNNAVETQLKMMLRGVDKVAEDAARAEGISTAEFVRRREAADKYFKETVVPLRKFFDGRSFERATAPVEQGGITTAAIYDNIAAVVNKDDVELARSFGKVLGERGRDSMVQVLAAEALRASELKGEGKAIEYVLKHQNVIREFLGRDKFTELMGMAKVAGVLTERVKSRSPKMFSWEHSIAPVFALSAIMSGHYAHAGKLMLVLPAFHLTQLALQRIHQTPIAKNLMRTAARMKPGSAELEALVDRTEGVIRRATVVGAGAADREMQTRQ